MCKAVTPPPGHEAEQKVGWGGKAYPLWSSLPTAKLQSSSLILRISLMWTSPIGRFNSLCIKLFAAQVLASFSLVACARLCLTATAMTSFKVSIDLPRDKHRLEINTIFTNICQYTLKTRDTKQRISGAHPWKSKTQSKTMATSTECRANGPQTFLGNVDRSDRKREGENAGLSARQTVHRHS